MDWKGHFKGNMHSLFSRKRYTGVPNDRQEDQTELTISSPFRPSAKTQAEEETILLEGPPSQRQKKKWIDGVYVCAKAGAGVLLLNLIFISIMAGLASRYSENRGFSSSAVIYRGNCGVSKRWDVALHLIINVLSTGILAASNYCMQTLVAPTREEVDAHHAQHKWLDIGGSSIKNLFAISRDRLALWVILMLTTTPFHLMYNSMVFESLSTNEYNAVIGPKDLNSSNVWNLTTPALEKCFFCPAEDIPSSLTWDDVATNIAAGNYERFSYEECYNFAQSDQLGVKAIIALADNLTVSDGGNASLLVADLTISFSNGGLLGMSFSNPDDGIGSNTTCNNRLAIRPNWQSDGTVTAANCGNYPISGCLAIKAEEHCELLYSPVICLVIMLTATVKVTAMFFAGRVSASRSPPLLTIGDAVASFMSNPDPQTKHLCWISRNDIHKKRWKSSEDMPIVYKRLQKRKLWMKATSGMRWLTTLTMCFTCIAVAIYLLTSAIKTWNLGVDSKSGSWISASQISQLFSSSVNTDNYGQIDIGDEWTMLTSVVVANTPQLIITISYYCYNSVLTSMLAAAEYNSYGEDHKPIRVTWPVKGSAQQSTYWLSVPYRYGVPILVIYMVLHWLISQSIFYLLLIPYDAQDNPDYASKLSALGYSPISIFLSILVGGLMVLILVVLAMKKFKSVMPLAGSCSAVISAACHIPADEDLETAPLGKVKWGQTVSMPGGEMVDFSNAIEAGKGHCSFTSLDAVRPTLTMLYA